MITYAILNFTDCAISLLLSVLVAIKGNQRKLRFPFSAWTFAIAIWSFGVGMHALRDIQNDAVGTMFWSHFLHYGAIPLPTFYLHFVMELCGRIKKRILYVSYALSAFFVALIPTKLIVSSVSPIYVFNFFPKSGTLYPLFIAHLVLCVTYSMYMLYARLQKVENIERNQVLYIIVGSLIGYPLASTAFLPMFNLRIFPFGTPFVIINAVMIAYAIARYKLMEITLLARNSAIYVASLLGFAAFVAWATVVCAKHYPFLAALPALLGVFATPTLYPLIKRRLGPFIDQSLFSGKFDYLDKIKVNLESLKDSPYTYEALAWRLIEVIRPLPMEMLSVYFLDIQKRKFFIKAQIGMKNGLAKDLRYNRDSLGVDEDDPLIRYITGNIPERVLLVIRDDILNGPRRRSLEVGAATTLERIEGEVCAPFLFSGLVKGFLVVGRKKGNRMFHEPDLKTIYAVSRMGEESMRYIMGMEYELRHAALYSHDMANDTKSLLQMIQMLQSPLFGEGFTKEIHTLLTKAADVTARLNQTFALIMDRSSLLLKSMRGEYTKQPTDIVKVVKESCMKFDLRVREKKVHFSVDLPNQPVSVNGNTTDLIRVVDNLLLNALRYVSENGHVKIEGKVSDYFRVSVQDDGQGIELADIERIWEFGWQVKDEKQGASGFGLSIARQIVQLHGGKIWVESAGKGKGTKFTFTIPLLADAVPSTI